MNWRCFGSSGHVNFSGEPNTVRFTKCELEGNHHIKTLFDVSKFVSYNSVHDINVLPGYFVKSTGGHVIRGPFNEHKDFSVIQLNHYKSKTLAEFRYIRTRQRADVAGNINENVDDEFRIYNINEIEDLSARNFYLNL